MTGTESRVAARAGASLRKVAATALAGSSIEWYDFFAYGTAAALVFPQLFFPKDLPPFVALIASFSTFAVGFIARPFGGIVFGHFGDRIGRKRALGVALYAMGIATTLIGCLPTYAAAGAIAPVLLVLLRFVQGFAVGGQWGGAVLLLTENAPAGRRGFYGSIAQVGVPVGIVFANLVFLLMDRFASHEALAAWGWRVPFLLSVLLIFIARYVHLHLDETPEFRALQAPAATSGAAPAASPVLAALRTYPREIALAAGAFLGVQVPFYILITYVIAYGIDPKGLALPYGNMLAAVLLSAFVMVPALLLAGIASDRFGRRQVYIAGTVLTGLWSFAVFPLIETGSFVLAVLALGVGQACVSLMYGPQAAFLSEMFAPRLRYSSVSLGYQCGAIVGGGLAPTIATLLLATFGSSVAIASYMAVACAIALLSVILLKQSHERALREARRADDATPS